MAGLVGGLQHGAAAVLGRYVLLLLLLLLLESRVERLFFHYVPGVVHIALGAQSSHHLAHAAAPHLVRHGGLAGPEAACSVQAIYDHHGDGFRGF